MYLAEPSDEALIHACLAGDAKKYAILVRRHQHKVFNVLYRFLGNHEASEDLSQETFLTAYQKLAMFSGNSKFSTWLCQIALNKARDLLRSQKVRNSLSENESDDQIELLTSEKDTPHHHAEMNEMNKHIQRILNEMPTTYREVLILKHLEGYSNEEIASVLETTVENIKVRTYRAREVFKQSYEKLLKQLYEELP